MLVGGTITREAFYSAVREQADVDLKLRAAALLLHRGAVAPWPSMLVALGLVGLKPTRGRLAQDAMLRGQPVRIVSDGVVTRSVRDAAALHLLLLRFLAGLVNSSTYALQL